MSSSTIVPASQIAKLQQGLNSALAPIAEALQASAYAESLPIIGPLATSAASHGEAALLQVETLKTKIFAALNAINGAPQTVGEIQTVISNALTGAGFDATGLQVDSVGGELTFTLDNSASNTFSTALSSNFGLPGLDFQTSGAAQAKLNYTLDVTGSVDTSGVFSASAPTGTALSASIDVTAPNFAASGTLGSANDTLLGDLRFGAMDNGSSLAGSFALDLNGGVTFTGDAALNVILTSDMGTAALPSISADLVGNWSYPDSGTPSIALDNVTYKLGTFIDNFLDPIIKDVNAVLQSTPVKDALAIFDTPLDFLGGGTVGNNGLLGPLWQELDVGGTIDTATGLDTKDGQITLVDFLQLAENYGAPIDVTPLVQFLDDVTQVQQWVSALSGSGTDFGSTTYNLGSFTIPDDVRNAAQQISQVVPVQNLDGQPQDLTALLDSLTGTGVSSGPGQPTPGQALKTLLSSPVFSFPIITKPVEAVQFLLGGTVDLFDATLPPATINFGSISATGVPVTTVPLISVPIPTSIPFITLDLALSAAFQGSVALDFGYDTSGVTAFANHGYSQPSDLLNGLFVQAETMNGTVYPVVQLAGAVQLGATLAAGDLASVSASGDVSGVLDLTFSHAGKNYLNTLANELQTNPFSIFDASGRITAGFEAVARAIFLSPWVYDSPRITLAQFDTADGAANTLSGPTSTTWIGGATGDFETAANWNPAFVLINSADAYGDSTIGAGHTVTFQGTVAADLTSLTLAASSVLSLAHGQFTIENSTTTSANSGDIVVAGNAHLILRGRLQQHRRHYHRRRHARHLRGARSDGRRQGGAARRHRHAPCRRRRRFAAVEPRQHHQRRRHDRRRPGELRHDRRQWHECAGAGRPGQQRRTAGGGRQRRRRRPRPHRRPGDRQPAGQQRRHHRRLAQRRSGARQRRHHHRRHAAHRRLRRRQHHPVGRRGDAERRHGRSRGGRHRSRRHRLDADADRRDQQRAVQHERRQGSGRQRQRHRAAARRHDP